VVLQEGSRVWRERNRILSINRRCSVLGGGLLVKHYLNGRLAMDADEPKTDQHAGVTPEDQPDRAARAEQENLSRIERLKKKLKKLQGKNPDIYPMW
jgi:hypothetical protein